LSLNGTQLLTKTNASPTAGLVGMRGNNAAFSNFDVQ
jgi:hypothetical protein